MATVTLTVVSNSDGTMTATTASAPAQTHHPIADRTSKCVEGLGSAGLRRHWTELMDEQPLGDLLSKALDRQERIREAVMPPNYAAQSLTELAKHDTADAYVAARRRQGGRG